MTSHDIGRHLHCYGRGSVVSPNLDSLARWGVRLEQAFATAPQCSPSRATLATGLYPHSNGVMGLAHHGFDWELDPTVPHAAAIFAGLGFETHLFGSQHVTLHPERLGFAHRHAPSRPHGNATDESIAEAVELMLADAGDRRLYLEINFEDTHRPYPLAARTDALDIPAYLPAGPEAAAEFAGLQAAITQMDAAAGRVFAALAAAGRADDALLAFTTDHGLAVPRAKCTLYDAGLEVALILSWPAGGIGGGVAHSELISNLDVLPTLLEACDSPPPPGTQGHSFLALLQGQAYQPREAIFAEKTFHSYYDPMRCVRTGRNKYIRNFETAFAVEVPADIQGGAIFRSDPSRYSTDRQSLFELYDLDEDPLEQHNLAGAPEVAALEGRLSAELWRWMGETDDPLLDGPIASPRNRLAMEP